MRGGWPGPGRFRLQVLRQVPARVSGTRIVLQDAWLWVMYQVTVQRAVSQVQTEGDNSAIPLL